jgi:hypothetical protein
VRSKLPSAEGTNQGRLGAYIPLVEVRIILTGFSSRISSTSRLPEKAAACASALRDRDDDFGSRSPPNSDWSTVRLPARLPVVLSRRAVLVAEEKFASRIKIAFAIDVSFFAASSSNHQMLANGGGAETGWQQSQSERSNESRSAIQAMSKLIGFRERLQRSSES